MQIRGEHVFTHSYGTSSLNQQKGEKRD